MFAQVLGGIGADRPFEVNARFILDADPRLTRLHVIEYFLAIMTDGGPDCCSGCHGFVEGVLADSILEAIGT